MIDHCDAASWVGGRLGKCGGLHSLEDSAAAYQLRQLSFQSRRAGGDLAVAGLDSLCRSLAAALAQGNLHDAVQHAVDGIVQLTPREAAHGLDRLMLSRGHGSSAGLQTLSLTLRRQRDVTPPH
jgi:hypothetical protein